MKIRHGFVSNSSSTNYEAPPPKKIAERKEISYPVGNKKTEITNFPIPIYDPTDLSTQHRNFMAASDALWSAFSRQSQQAKSGTVFRLSLFVHEEE